MRTPRATLTLALALVGLVAACPDKKPKYPSCAGDKDCQAGEHCVNKKCVQCGEDAHCGAGMACVDGACVKKLGCESNADCEDGKVCKNGKCYACNNDNDCGEGAHCIEGGCLREGECRSDDDCPEDEDCIEGKCKKAMAQPTGDDLPACKLQPIQFGLDQYAIPDEAKTALQENADCLNSTTRKVAVIGHTDPRGTDEYNIGLSDDRAQSVITYLARLGVDPARMRKVPKGEADATGSDETSWALDRRVDFLWE